MNISVGSFDLNWGEGHLLRTLFAQDSRRGVSVDVFSREDFDASVLESAGVYRVHRIKTPAYRTPELDLINRALFSFKHYRAVKTLGSDVIHGFCFNTYPLHRLGIPYILDDIIYPTYIDFIESEIPKLGPNVYLRTKANLLPFKYSVRRECENASALIVPSKYQKEKLLEKFKVDEEKIRVIPYGIRPPTAEEKEGGEAKGGLKTILFAGNDYLRKGLHYLIKAMPGIIGQNPETILVVLGAQTGNHARSRAAADYIRKLVKEKKLGGKIFFMGQASFKEAQRYMSLCDVLCIPTLSDSCNRSVLEAISHETPIVTSPQSGFPEIDEAGIQVEPRNPDSIAEAVTRLLEDDKLVKKKKIYCKKAIKEYSWEKIAAQYIRVYEEVKRA